MLIFVMPFITRNVKDYITVLKKGSLFVCFSSKILLENKNTVVQRIFCKCGYIMLLPLFFKLKKKYLLSSWGFSLSQQ